MNGSDTRLTSKRTVPFSPGRGGVLFRFCGQTPTNEKSHGNHCRNSRKPLRKAYAAKYQISNFTYANICKSHMTCALMIDCHLPMHMPFA